MTATPGLSPLDESFSHQLVAPAAETLHRSPAWAERCYHLLHAGPGLTLNAGRAVWPHDGRRSGFVGVATPHVEHCLRVGEPFAAGDDPDRPTVETLRIEPLEPLRRVRIALEDPAFPVQVELAFTARFPAVPTHPNRIERDGQVVTDYMNFFQSGIYDGTVAVEGVEHRIDGRLGFRDRGWGLRKHEGAPRRGLVVFCGCELANRALYLLLYESASGRRVFTNGWLMDEGGVSDEVAGAEHDLRFDGTLLAGGEIEVLLASGGTATLELDVENRLYLEGVGYSADPERSVPGSERFNLIDPAVIAAIDGQNDNGCRFSFDGEPGYGYVETGVGAHVRYRPQEGG